MGAERESGRPEPGRQNLAGRQGLPEQQRSSPDCSLPRRQILRRRADVERVMRSGIKVSGPCMYLRYAPNPESAERRVAFLLPRTIRRAVDRNRLKRRMREVYRLNKERFPAGCDVLMLLSPSAATLDFGRLDELTRELAARIPHGKTA